MVVAGHLKLMALDLACQRLARRAKALATVGAALDAAKATEVDRLVTQALAMLGEDSWKPTSEPETKKKPSANLLLRMLRGKDEAAPTPTRVENAPPSDQHALSLRGEGDSFPPPDLLGFLSSQRKTGTLEVVTGAGVFTLEFHEGDVVHAHVNPTIPDQRLGDLLVSSGAIARQTLEKLREEGLSQRLGEALLAKNLVTREQLIAALQAQVQLLFNRMFGAPVTRFTFWNGPPILADEGMRLNAMALLFEGARTHDETTIVDPRDYPKTIPEALMKAAAEPAAEEAELGVLDDLDAEPPGAEAAEEHADADQSDEEESDEEPAAPLPSAGTSAAKEASGSETAAERDAGAKAEG